MSEVSLPAPVPAITPETKPFWEGTTQGKLLLPRCDNCGQLIWYPRGFCPECGSLHLSWTQASGRGSIYSFTINRRGQGDYRDVDAYALAYVELEEGPRILTNIVDCDLASLAIGQPVEVVFHDTGQGAALPRFRPRR
ncbi:MAG TPA: Zn-ribbon domain-containing OB-fold protein [Chloroflexota bacterium]|nr:Zn-ribbon domain-containing OB-fold protein [Chloroflexota bacterium]